MASYTNNNKTDSKNSDKKNKDFEKNQNLGNNYSSKFGNSRQITDSSINKYYKKYIRNQIYIQHNKKIYDLIEQLDEPKAFKILKEEYDKENELIKKSSSDNKNKKHIDFSSQCINLSNYKSKTDKQFKASLKDYDFMYTLMNLMKNRPKKIKKPKINQYLLKLCKNIHHKNNNLTENNTKKTYPNLKSLFKNDNVKKKERKGNSFENNSSKMNNPNKSFNTFNNNIIHENMNKTQSIFNQTNYTYFYNNINYNKDNNNENISHKNSNKIDFSENDSISLNNNNTEENAKIRYSIQSKKINNKSSNNTSSLQKQINSINPNKIIKKNLTEMRDYDKYAIKKKLIKKYKCTMKEFLQKIKYEERNLYSNGDKISKLINNLKRKQETSFNDENEKTKNYFNRNNNNEYNKIICRTEKSKNKTSQNFFNSNAKFKLPELNRLIYGADNDDPFGKLQLELYYEVKKNVKKKVSRGEIKIYSIKTGNEMIKDIKLLNGVKPGKIFKKINRNEN